MTADTNEDAAIRNPGSVRSIAFSRDLLWDGLAGVVLPLRYESDDWAVRPPRATGSAGRE